VTKRELQLLLVLTALVIASAVSVVYAKYLSRLDFVSLQALIDERHGLEVQWSRLRLEEAALTTHPRVEERARQHLGMHLPVVGEVWVIEANGDVR
jgi:cell division protein FtsL